MTPDQQARHHQPEASETTASVHSSRPLKNHFVDDALGVAFGIAVGWLGEITMQSAGFTLFALS
ncbi:hypothetical protein [Limnohabitans planktonicus]|uniref:Uncharacterized protein n=1 Tax=Limnohabitans planktonicus II-D5 TaxID=1293045 RepID=A0A2T7U9T4_9BURK|nr:hypothetical protein [Limnohabitans planktonicus]PVE41391.1 hypothetical protein H663_017660 [Limnohabitans planktonicus II-D5]